MVRPPRPVSPKFDAAWRRKRNLARIWRGAKPVLVLAAVLLVGWWLMRLPVFGGDWEAADNRFTVCGERGSKACVVDGDTISLADGSTRRRIRLTGYDAPELDGECEAERLLALQSREVLQGWLNRSPFELDGGEDPPRDTYGRELRGARRVEAGREDWLADFMVKRGLARRSALDRGWCG